MKARLIHGMKYMLIGRDVTIFDRLIYFLSRGQSSGWVVGNKLRAFFYGRKKGVCTLPVIFIGCFPRSGSTLLRAMLQEHPKIAAGQTEINVFQDIKNVSPQENQMNVVDAFSITPKEKKHIQGKTNLVDIADYLLKNYKKRKQADYVLLKQPQHIFFIKEIFKYFPNAKFIHIYRDGRDATMSQRYYMLPEGRKEWPYEWCCRQWNVCINRGKQYRGHKNYIEVKYEDLVAHPDATLKTIFSFLGIKDVPKNLVQEYYKKFDATKRPDHKEVSSPLTTKNVNKWTSKQNTKDKTIFKKIAGKNFTELGYHF